MKGWLQSNSIKVYTVLGVTGAALGLVYWNFWGCTEGCPIDASPWWSLLRGGAIGLSLGGIMYSFVPEKKKTEETHSNE